LSVSVDQPQSMETSTNEASDSLSSTTEYAAFDIRNITKEIEFLLETKEPEKNDYYGLCSRIHPIPRC
jgi:hypothetical protein